MQDFGKIHCISVIYPLCHARLKTSEINIKYIKWIKIGAGVLLAVIAIVGGRRFYKARKARKQAEKL